jgi:hypothetical protein
MTDETTDKTAQLKREFEELELRVSFSVEFNFRNLPPGWKPGAKLTDYNELGQIPREYVRTEEVDRTLEMLKNINVISPVTGQKFGVVFPKDTVHSVYSRIKSGPLANFLKESPFENSLIVMRSDFSKMHPNEVARFVTNVVENSPSIEIQYESAKRNDFFIFVCGPKDWYYYMNAPTGLTRRSMANDILYDSDKYFLVSKEWTDEFNGRLKSNS